MEDGTYWNCQSCGMPIHKDDYAKGGTNADGSKSKMYCHYCYQHGQFTTPDWSAEQMRDFCTGKLQEKGFPKFLAKMFTKNIPKLERWKQ